LAKHLARNFFRLICRRAEMHAALETILEGSFPRPPAWICAFTTTFPLDAARDLSRLSGLEATRPFEVATPYFSKSSRAWYSWMFKRRDDS
jgi:hypothetical protein